MFGLGIQELLILLAIIMLLFGATRLPELGKGIGQAIKNFRKSTSEPDEIEMHPDSSKKKNTSKDSET